MDKKYKITGLWMEFAGLVFVFIATFWQAQFSGWWDKQSPEWQYWIQEEVNIQVLSVLGDVATLAATDDLETRKRLANETSLRANNAISHAIDMRNERAKAIKGQASQFSKISLFLVLTGALLLIIGKYLAVQATREEII